MSVEKPETIGRRIYPLDSKELTEEQIAVVFAMTSRSTDPFDVIAQRVSESKAAQFHDRIVLNYGHASVAEHAIIHMAIENVSRLVCDEIEDNRLASYTELSSRYLTIASNNFHVPREMAGHPLRDEYVETCRILFKAYDDISNSLQLHLREIVNQRNNETDRSYDDRLRRRAMDNARFLLPAATLTNVGLTINARGMEHAVTKLSSSYMAEANEIGEEIKSEAEHVTPTLIKYANPNEYLYLTRTEQELSAQIRLSRTFESTSSVTRHGLEARIVHHDREAEQKLVAALMFRYFKHSYETIWANVQEMDHSQREVVIDNALRRLGSHDVPVRELESVDYTFELVMDYGAYREFKRHRMQTYIPQLPTVANGYVVPARVIEAGLGDRFEEALAMSARTFERLSEDLPEVAPYIITHAHKRRVLSKMNLRECYHLFKLRTQPTAHFTLREVVGLAMEMAKDVHPLLFRYLRLRT